MAALRPGQSPPAVSIPKVLVTLGLKFPMPNSFLQDVVIINYLWRAFIPCGAIPKSVFCFILEKSGANFKGIFLNKL
jgi:hypothetical protein